MRIRGRIPWRAVLATAILSGGLTAALALSSETERLVEALALRDGMSVADVGAGDGEWTERLAEKVGPRGRVFATEVDETELDKLEERISRAGLDNVTIVRGSQQDTGLPDGCCEAVLLRMVYHHFTQPSQMRASLRRALRPGGRLVIVDTEPQSAWTPVSGVPDRGGHGIAESDLTSEMAAAGFEVVARYEDWNGRDDRYGVVFRRVAPAGDEAAAPEPDRSP